MPPLAITKRGGKVLSVRFTTATTAAETVRAIFRLAAASSVLMSRRLVWTMTSPLRRASTTAATGSRGRLPRVASEKSFDVDLDDAGGAVLGGQDVELARGEADMRANNDEATGCRGGVAFVGLLAAECLADFLADAAADEGRAHPVEQLLAAAFGFLQSQGQCAEVVLGDDVGDDRAWSSWRVRSRRRWPWRRSADLRRSRGPGADDVQVEDDHVAGREAALRLLLHILGQLGIGEAEARILGELGLGNRGELAGVVPGAAHVVHAADGDAPGVGERRDDDDAVGRFAGHVGDRGGNDVRFERVVAAEGGVGAADEPQAQPGTSSVRGGCGEGVPHDFLVAGSGLNRVQAARVGQHVDGGLGLAFHNVGECPREIGDLPAGEHRQVRD